MEYHFDAIYIKKASIQSVLFVKPDDINSYKPFLSFQMAILNGEQLQQVKEEKIKSEGLVCFTR